MIYIQILFIFLATIYFTWWLVLFYAIQSKQIKSNTASSSEIVDSVEIIVAAHNELENLKVLLPLLISQKHPLLSITIVLDRPCDGSDIYLQSFNHPSIKILLIKNVPQNVNPKKYALHTAIIQSNATYLLLTDADCIPNSNQWVTHMYQAIQGYEVCLGLSFYKYLPTFLNRFIQFETWLTAFQMLGWSALKYPYMALGRNFMYKKSLFEKVNGFKHLETLGGDDDLFLQQIAPFATINFIDHYNSQTLSNPKTNFKSWWHQKQRHLQVGLLYSKQQLLLLSIYPIVSTLLLILFIVFCPQIWISVVLFCIFKIVIQFYVLRALNKRWGQSISIFWFLILEFIYINYIFIAGIQARLFKIHSWQKTKS